MPGLLAAVPHPRPRTLRGTGLAPRSRAGLMSATAEIGIFGGSGFYEWLDAADEIEVTTPYGPPSGSIALADVGGRRVAFLPRHGPNHEVAAPFVNYRANVCAIHELGARRLIGPAEG